MKVFAFFISIFFHTIILGLASPTCTISVRDVLAKNGICSCNIKITAPNGWKFPQPPNITIRNATDFSEIMQDVTTQSNTECVIHIAAKYNLLKNLQLSVDSPICSNVCVLSNNDIEVDFVGYSLVLLYMLFGLIGGLLLNVMPCVLPVILMKLRAFNNRIGLIGSICGNFVTFAIITIGLIFLKSIGTLIGWGMHFQSTGFLVASTILLLILTLQAFGILHIKISISSHNSSKSIFWKNFASSMIATFIAIPCTAPLLGVAITFAIQGTTFQLIMVFLSIAIGFSFPYILALLFKLRPPQISGKIGGIFNRIVNIGVLITFLWVLWLLIQNISSEKSNFNQTSEAIQNSISNNEIVMLSVTADWCLTCKYNKKRLLSNAQLKKVMNDYNVRFIEVDITKKDQAVTEFLHKHNRVGIPFIMIYGANAKDGILLDEIPSIHQTIDAIKKARQK